MKYTNLFIVTIVLFFFSCTNRSYNVAGETNTDANLDEYSTYGFASQVDSELDEGLYFLNDLVLKAKIRDAVKHEMDSRGYEYSANSPDLIVNFRVFDKATQVNDLNDYGDDYWGAVTPVAADNEEVNLQPGSIMVHLVERESGRIVWQGYASGLMDGNVFNKEEEKITEAVSMVFDTYNQRADQL